MTQSIRITLEQGGLAPRYTGFNYLVDAIETTLYRNLALNITQEIYPVLAIKYDTTHMAVERNIRTLITHTWKDNNCSYLANLYKESFGEKKPTNKDFICFVAEYIAYEYGLVRKVNRY